MQIPNSEKSYRRKGHVVLGKRSTFLCILIVIGLLAACSSSETENTFVGTIETINDKMAIVEIEEGEILRSGDIASVDLSIAREINFEVGDKVKVGYDGAIRESYPLGINTTFVELIE